MRERLQGGASFNVFQNSRRMSGDIVSFVAHMCDEGFKPYAEACMAYFDDPSRISRYRSAIAAARGAAEARLKALAAEALAALDAYGSGREICNRTLLGLFEQAAAGRVRDGAKFGFRADKALTVRAVCDEGAPAKIYTKTRLPKLGRDTVWPPQQLTDTLRGAAVAMREEARRIEFMLLLGPAARGLEFLGLAWQYVARYRRDNNLVLMSDTNDLLRRIINGAEVPFIYERIGVELHHFLIDEFQDTSVMQWENLRPLVANGLAEQADSLIIGDEKQAIYRFRNSDSSLLHHRVAAEDFPASTAKRGSDPADNTNHRSAHGIVRFNNALFARLADELGVEGYENVRQALFSRFDGLGAYVEMRSLDAIAQADADRSPDEASMHAMAADILRQHDAGYRWRDIAILDARNDNVNMLVEFLMREYPAIPLCSAEGMRLDRSAAVNLIISVLKYVDRSYGPESALRPDDGGYASHHDILLMLSRFEYAVGKDGCDLREALDRAMGEGSVADLSAEALSVRGACASSLSALVEVIIARCVPPAQREREFAYLAAFQDCVLDYCAVYNPSVHAFLAWWERKSSRLTVGASASLDAVTVMTVHKAKGLEWACVHLPFAKWSLAPKKETEWMPAEAIDIADPADRPPVLPLPTSSTWRELGPDFAARYDRNVALQLADRLNLTYVAFTRPSRELIVHYGGTTLGPVVERALQATHPDDTLPESLCLPDGQCADEPGRYVFGEPTVPQARTTPAEAPAPAPAYIVSMRDDTRELTTVTDITAAALEQDLDIGNEQPTRDDASRHSSDAEERARAAAAERGNDLHNILAQMRTPDDLQSAIRLTGVRARYTPQQADDYARTLSEAFRAAADHCSRWFGPDVRVMTERTIYVPSRRESFRPDRIVTYPDGTIDIIDYKFTSEPQPAHLVQVRGYMRMLRDMGRTRLRGYLWYPELHRVIEVPAQ